MGNVQLEVTLVSAVQLVRDPLDDGFDIQLHRCPAPVVRVRFLDAVEASESADVCSWVREREREKSGEREDEPESQAYSASLSL